MAPKMAKPKLSAMPKLTVTRRGTKPPLLKVDPKTCESCGQTTHDYDRHALKAATLVRWPNVVMSKTLNKLIPQGRECGPCKDTRVRYFDASLDDFIKHRKRNAELDADFEAKREAKVQHKHTFRNEEKLSMEKWLKQREEQYQDEYQTGFFTELNRFMRKRLLRPDRYDTVE